MPQVELFFGNQNINLTASVGEHGTNLKNDVMVVQAMLKTALEGRILFRGVRFPHPTGAINKETIKLIKQYQRYEKESRTRITVDGRIDPAKGERRFGKCSFWTILALNSLVFERWFLSDMPHNNPIEDLCHKFPQLYTAIDDVPVGTLDLSLEPSPIRVGSLNLGLE
jgi:hypothetical protein